MNDDTITYSCLTVENKEICDTLTSGRYQLIRLIDVFILAPAMIYGGAQLINRSPLTGYFLIISGLGTLFFNGKNFVKIKKLHNAN